MFAFFGGALLKSLFVQTILNQYKRSHPPTDAEVTIVVTDVQASTQLWQKASVHMNRALAIHDKIMRAAIHQTFGYEVLTEGDSFVIAFHSAGDALKFAMLFKSACKTTPGTHRSLECVMKSTTRTTQKSSSKLHKVATLRQRNLSLIHI